MKQSLILGQSLDHSICCIRGRLLPYVPYRRVILAGVEWWTSCCMLSTFVWVLLVSCGFVIVSNRRISKSSVYQASRCMILAYSSFAEDTVPFWTLTTGCPPADKATRWFFIFWFEKDEFIPAVVLQTQEEEEEVDDDGGSTIIEFIMIPLKKQWTQKMCPQDVTTVGSPIK